MLICVLLIFVEASSLSHLSCSYIPVEPECVSFACHDASPCRFVLGFDLSVSVVRNDLAQVHSLQVVLPIGFVLIARRLAQAAYPAAAHGLCGGGIVGRKGKEEGSGSVNHRILHHDTEVSDHDE